MCELFQKRILLTIYFHIFINSITNIFFQHCLVSITQGDQFVLYIATIPSIRPSIWNKSTWASWYNKASLNWQSKPLLFLGLLRKLSRLTNAHQIVWQLWRSWQSRRENPHGYDGERAQKCRQLDNERQRQIVWEWEKEERTRNLK